jgi:DNA-binding MurR/RpiR family transcriptional regulator
VGRLAIDAIHQTMDLVEPEQLEQAVSLIEKAPRVVCIGSGGSVIMANTFAHLFSAVTGKFQAIADSHMQMSAVATMGREDIVVLFSYSGATNAGLQILELAKERGVKTILITRFSKSPAASLADVVLRCGSNEGPFQSGSVPAKVAQLMVMDMLYQEYCHRNQEACEENIRRIAAALSDMHV